VAEGVLVTLAGLGALGCRRPMQGSEQYVPPIVTFFYQVRGTKYSYALSIIRIPLGAERPTRVFCRKPRGIKEYHTKLLIA
jgi:hypothetical protein